jgi:hypothetical protein
VRDRKHWLALLLALLIASAGCNGDDDDEAGRSTTTERPTTTTTTTTQPTTTTTTPIAGPEPWTGIVRDLFRRDWALQTRPDPNAVAALYHENCECYQVFREDIEGLVARGEHVEGSAPVPVAVMTTGEGGGGFRRLIVKVEYGPQRVIDANGAVIGETPGQDPLCISMLVAATGPNGTHQIHDYFFPEQCPDEL